MKVLVAAIITAATGMFGCSVPDHKVPPPPTEVSTAELGISPGAELLSLSPDELTSAMTDIAATGATWVRVDIAWPAVQADSQSWDFIDEDRVVNSAVAQNLQIVAVAGYRPAWATTGAGDLDVDAYATFIGTAVDRYGDRVDAWELWNEPNLARSWGGPADAQEYARAAIAARREAVAARAGTTVVAGGLSPANDVDGNRAPVDFLTEVYAADGGDAFDAVAIHPYGYPAAPDEAGTESWNTWARIADIRALLDDNGGHAKEIWITEFGAPTGSADVAVSETRQAEIVATGVRKWRELPGMGPMFVYSLRDRGPDKLDVEQNFGLRRVDGTPKPAYDEFINATNSLRS